jgi:uncharacterized surface protein with fasciclin (FAS1) repeats
MNTFKTTATTMLVALALSLSTAAFATKPSEQTTIVDVAVSVNESTGEFSTLLFAASLYPDIVAYLDGMGQRTLFAPTDAAFANLEAILPLFCYNTIVELATDQPDYIADVLAYHATKGRKDAAEVLPKDQIRMLTGDFVTRVPGSLVITDALGRDATLLAVDIGADNGVIHVISEVILPYPPASACN